jgi:hypothetical protein
MGGNFFIGSSVLVSISDDFMEESGRTPATRFEPANNLPSDSMGFRGGRWRSGCSLQRRMGAAIANCEQRFRFGSAIAADGATPPTPD